MTRLQNFAAQTLRLVPVALWWVMALLAGVVASIQFEKELWPHTPGAVVVARWVGAVCLFSLPVLGVVWIWRIALHVGHPGWRLLWQLAATGATCLGLGLLIVFALVFIVAG